MPNSRKCLRRDLETEIGKLEELRQQMKEDVQSGATRDHHEELSRRIRDQKGVIATLSEALLEEQGS
ncbi:hypothetical protein SAMN05444487_10620 [Marininema mesophilum]|uniref:Uncharacterized protein n=1 Tax=Marininema mesophilum TaxID=1048340 RepID=A0A1H2W518_9BACL|nr:hypothetical protein [Marininema mesophilum]SDW75680.1 hypothetical protein SAMN05444487_10620 [Marininema mesophilum]